MPRFGHNRIFDDQQTRDVGALLLYPQPSVNK
jgi:hypothetical protein